MSTLILELIGFLCTYKIIITIIEIKAFIGNKNNKTNIFRMQAYDSILCGYFYIGFIDFMLKGKNLTEYTNLFPPNNFKKNDDIILNFFMGKFLKKKKKKKWMILIKHEIYPNLRAIPSNEQQFRLNKLMKLKIIF